MTITIHNGPNGSSLEGGPYGDSPQQVLVAGGDSHWQGVPSKTLTAGNLTLPTGSAIDNSSGNASISNDHSPVVDICNATLFPYMDLTQSDSIRTAFVVIYIIVIVLSLTGNWLVIWTVIRNKYMRTVTNYYIVNLAVSDFLVAFFVMPLKLLEFTAPCAWHIFNEDALCSFMSYVLPVFVFASVLTLVAISMERYYAIVYPLSAMKVHSKSRTRKILTCTWIIPMIVASPYLYCKSYTFQIYSHLGSISRQICTDRFDEIDVAINVGRKGQFRKGYFMFLFIAIYLVPLIVILTTCVRIAMRLLKPIVEKQESAQGQRITRKREENKRRVARMIIVVAIAFIVAWSPFYLVTFISQVQTRSFLRNSNHVFVMLAVHLVGFINSCINPFIYNFMSDKFRKNFAQILISMCCFCASARIRTLFSTAHGRSFRTSEYDGVYSMGDDIKGKNTAKSPERHKNGHNENLSRRRGSQSPRETTTIIRLCSLKKKNSTSSSTGLQQISPDHYAPHLTNGTATPSATGKSRGKGRDLTGDSCFSHDSEREENVTVETVFDREKTLENDMDLFVDSSTSKLLRDEAAATS